MARYHFNVYDGLTAIDGEGTFFATIAGARAEAMHLAGKLLNDEANKARLGDDWRVEVTDDRGLILFRIDVLMAASAAAGRA